MHLQPTDALLIIDMQVDFLPGGSLAVAGGDTIIPPLNTLAARFDHVLLTQDWHPAGHISFASTHGLQPFTDTGQSLIAAPYGTQALWPDHCLQGTPAANFPPELNIPHAELILRKGFRPDLDSYSAFTENDGTTTTGLAAYLQARGLNRLFFVGLATDYCVGFSALAATKLGFESIVIDDLTCGIAPTSIATTHAAFSTANVQRIKSNDIA